MADVAVIESKAHKAPAIRKAAAHAPVVMTEQERYAAIVTKAMSDPSVDMDKLERLCSLMEKAAERDKEAEFNASLREAQSKMGRISADATNPQTRSRYATYAKLDSVLRPVYTSEGFSLSFNTEPSPIADHVRVIAYVSHSAGHTRKYTVDMPNDGMGAKGNAVMTKTHAMGAAHSYGMRYLLKMIFNVAVGEDDNDGNVASSAPAVSEAQLAQLQQLIVQTDTKIERFTKAYKIASVDKLPASKFDDAVSKLRMKLEQGL